MKFAEAIDRFCDDMIAEGRMAPPRNGKRSPTEVNYRITLDRHADDVNNRDPRYTNRDDVKNTLARWPHPNTRRKNRSILASFYDWTMQELEPGRKDNPAKQTRPPKQRPSKVYRMTRDEVVAFLAAATTVREHRVSHLGVCAGIRSFELRHLQRRHFERDGFVHVSHDIGKGGRERWIPVLPELQPIVDEILETVEPSVFDRRKDAWIGEYVIPGERWRDPGRNTVRMDVKLRPASRQVLRTVVMELGERAGIHAHLHPHLMRHAFGDHVARYAGMRNAQAMLGHADVGTTQMYTGAPTLDELAAAVSGYRFSDSRTGVLGIAGEARDPREAPTRIELVEEPTRLVEPFLRDMLDHLAPTALLYAEHFGGAR